MTTNTIESTVVKALQKPIFEIIKLVALIILAITGWSLSVNYDNMEQEIKQNKMDINVNTNRINQGRVEMMELRTDIKNTREDIQEIKEDIKDLNKKIDQLLMDR